MKFGDIPNFDHYLSLAQLRATLFTVDAASKHASQAFFDSLRSEVAKDNINVSVINPGYIRTNLSKNAMTGDGSKHGGTYLFDSTRTIFLVKLDEKHLIFLC